MKWVLITGASRGIGAAIARRLAQDGFAVALNYRVQQDKAQALLEDIQAQGGSGTLVGFDVADRAATQAALDGLLERTGALYGVVLSAGVTADKPFPALEGADWDRVLQTNLTGAYNALQPLVMPMIQARAGGRIIALSSVAGLTGNRGQTNYAASKAGLVGLVKSLALELAKRKITVNAVAPGLIETDMLENLDQDQARKLIPLGRLGQAEEVAGLVSYLFSDQAAYLTGQVIAIDGGLS